MPQTETECFFIA